MNHLKSWVLWIAVTSFVSWIAWTSPAFKQCVQDANQNYAQNSFQEHISSLYILLIGYRLCVGGFIDSNRDSIIALFTVILGIATWALWKATKNLVVGAEVTARHQLRAYISYEGGAFEFADAVSQVQNRTAHCRFIIINFGQTPAKNVRIIWKTWMSAERDFMLDTLFEEKTGGGTTKFFAPNAKIPLSIGFSRSLSSDEFIKFQTGYLVFRATIHITYDDAFGHQHLYNFGRGLRCETLRGQIYETLFDGVQGDDDSD
jgi:hypothetical protein